MSIDSTNNNVSHINRPRTDGVQDTRRTGGVKTPAESGRPADTSASTRVTRMQTGDTTGDINATRVAEIRQGIADGSLTFDADRIADGLIASLKDF